MMRQSLRLLERKPETMIEVIIYVRALLRSLLLTQPNRTEVSTPRVSP